MKQLKTKQTNMLLGKLGASLLGNLLAGKSTIRGDEITIRVDQGFSCF